MDCVRGTYGEYLFKLLGFAWLLDDPRSFFYRADCVMLWLQLVTFSIATPNEVQSYLVELGGFAAHDGYT